MTLTEGLTTLEILYLEDALNEECKCESNHARSECSVEVVALKILTCEGVRFLICQNSYDWNQEAISEPYYTCDQCKRSCSVCWKIVAPI